MAARAADPPILKGFGLPAAAENWAWMQMRDLPFADLDRAVSAAGRTHRGRYTANRRPDRSPSQRRRQVIDPFDINALASFPPCGTALPAELPPTLSNGTDAGADRI